MRPAEAAAPAVHEVDDPIEESPAPLQAQLDAAAQEKASPAKRGRGRQRKQLKAIYADEERAEGADCPRMMDFVPRAAPSFGLSMRVLDLCWCYRTTGLMPVY